jgi:catechol 2,3-dioxygenase-like lactoylglutathione lyase family enzyme
MKVVGLDHIVLTVASIGRTVEFYQRVLGMEAETFGKGQRTALKFGPHKINLHERGREFEPRAAHAIPGSADVCFLVDDVRAVATHLERCQVPIVEGPVKRTGARGQLLSYYIRDPDQNLIELSEYVGQ